MGFSALGLARLIRVSGIRHSPNGAGRGRVVRRVRKDAYSRPRRGGLFAGAAFLLVVAACSTGAAAESLSPSPESTQYLAAVEGIQDQVDEAFDRVQTAMTQAYPTREVFFGAVKDVGYTGLASNALNRAETLAPPPGYEEDHDAWLAHRSAAPAFAEELEQAAEQGDMKELLAVFTRLSQDFAVVLASTSREFCLAVSFDHDLCPAPDNLPGGEYGEEIYEILRLNGIASLGLFDFVRDMSPEERATRLDQVQPSIEANLKAGGDAFKQIEPPDEYQAGHRAFIRYFDEQYATAVAITAANAAGDVSTVLELFDESGVVAQRVDGALSGDYRDIAAPFLD